MKLGAIFGAREESKDVYFVCHLRGVLIFFELMLMRVQSLFATLFHYLNALTSQTRSS
jgi:hypothetical protein